MTMRGSIELERGPAITELARELEREQARGLEPAPVGLGREREVGVVAALARVALAVAEAEAGKSARHLADGT